MTVATADRRRVAAVGLKVASVEEVAGPDGAGPCCLIVVATR